MLHVILSKFSLIQVRFHALGWWEAMLILATVASTTTVNMMMPTLIQLPTHAQLVISMAK